jgi:general secretion pathway protein K
MARDNRKSGVVLVLVLWTIVLLSALAMAASTTFRGFAGVIGLSQDRVKAEALLDAGVEAAAAIVGRVSERRPLSPRTFDVSLATGSAHIELSDETGRIDINKAPVKVLSALLEHSGVDGAGALAQAIDIWRLRDRPAQTDPATAAASLDAPSAQDGAAKKASDKPPAFSDVRQLIQTPGMTRAIIAAIAPLVTVFGDDKVNALTASPEVLLALPGTRRAQVDALVEARRRLPVGDGQLEAILGSAGDYVKSQGRAVAAVEVTAVLLDGYRQAARVTIVVLPHDRLSYRILAWAPSPPAPSRSAALAGGS